MPIEESPHEVTLVTKLAGPTTSSMTATLCTGGAHQEKPVNSARRTPAPLQTNLEGYADASKATRRITASVNRAQLATVS
jgi:hypothetical protein